MERAGASLKKDFELRSYRPGDEHGIVQLLQSVFGRWPKIDLNCEPVDHWRWKYLENPVKNLNVVVGVSENEIISCHHGLRHRIKIGDEVYLGSIAMDLAVHPDFRGMGLFPEMTGFLAENSINLGVRFAHWLTGNPLVIKRNLKTRPQFPYPIKNLVRIENIDKLLEVMPIKYSGFYKQGYYLAKFSNALRNKLRPQPSSKNELLIRDATSFDDGIDEFWRQVSDKYAFIVDRSRAYLNWRYSDPRAGSYVIRQAMEGSRLLGYCVLLINRYLRDCPVGYIVDLLALPGRLDVVDVLAADSLRYFDENDVNVILWQTVRDHPYQRILNGHGFLDSRIKFHLFYNPLVEPDVLGEIENCRAEQIFLTWGDHVDLPIGLPGAR